MDLTCVEEARVGDERGDPRQRICATIGRDRGRLPSPTTAKESTRARGGVVRANPIFPRGAWILLPRQSRGQNAFFGAFHDARNAVAARGVAHPAVRDGSI